MACTFYHASLTTVNLLPENISELDVLTNFDAEAFVIRGEITYEKFKVSIGFTLNNEKILNNRDSASTIYKFGLEVSVFSIKQLYYVYILAQSDLLQLFAIAYDLDKWRDDSGTPLPQLTRITVKLRDSLISEKNRLEKALVMYENSKRRTNDRKFR